MFNVIIFMGLFKNPIQKVYMANTEKVYKAVNKKKLGITKKNYSW